MINEATDLAGNEVILKFQYGKRGSVNPTISKTMGKIAVINHAYQGDMPQPGVFWLCRIDKELTNTVGGNGAFVVTPLKPVEIDKIKKLIPNAYDIEIKEKKVICRPKVDGIYWIVPFSIKKFYIKKEKAKIQYEAILVPLRAV